MDRWAGPACWVLPASATKGIFQRFFQVKWVLTGGRSKEAMKLHPRGMLCGFLFPKQALGREFWEEGPASDFDLPVVTAGPSGGQQIERCPPSGPCTARSCSWDTMGLTTRLDPHLEGL